MKTIKDLNSVEFLRQCNRIRKEVAVILKAIKFDEIRSRQPKLTGEETTEERKALVEAQRQKNMNELLDMALEKKPEETAKLLELFVIPEEGDKELKGFEVAMKGIEIINDPAVMDFLSSLIASGKTDTAMQ